MKNKNLWFNQSGNVVTLAEHCDGAGLSADLAPGTYRHSDIVSGFNDTLSYVSVPAGMKVILYEHTRDTAEFTDGATLEIVGPKTVNFCSEHTEFNDKMSEIDVIYTGVTGDSDDNQDGDGTENGENGENGFELDTSAAISYCKDQWDFNTEQCEELVDYVNRHILKNDSWIEHTENRAEERGRTYENQLLHEARWQLYSKEDCKYCKKDEVIVTPPPPAQAGIGASIPWIIAGVAIIGGLYFFMNRNR